MARSYSLLSPAVGGDHPGSGSPTLKSSSTPPSVGGAFLPPPLLWEYLDSVGPAPKHQQRLHHQDGRLEPWYSYTHWFPMASAHVMKDGGPEPVPRMQPAMMMFSSKYWSRRGMSLDSAMFNQQNQQQQRHTGGQMVRAWTPLPPSSSFSPIRICLFPGDKAQFCQFV